MEIGFYKVVTDGNRFRVVHQTYGDKKFVRKTDGTGTPIEFSTQTEAENHIHRHLSMAGWHEVKEG